MQITAIVSVFNGAFFLESFAKNAQRQTIFKDIEFLVIDANSDDNGPSLIKDFLSLENVRYIPLKERISVYEAWNLGVSEAKSEFLCNWNIDDRRFPPSLEEQLEGLKADGSDLCYGKVYVVNEPNIEPEDSEIAGVWSCYFPNLQSMLLSNSPHCHPLWRKSIHERFGLFNTSYKHAADYDMWLRALLGGAKFLSLPFVDVGTYYSNPEGISTGDKNLRNALLEVAKIRNIYG